MILTSGDDFCLNDSSLLTSFNCTYIKALTMLNRFILLYYNINHIQSIGIINAIIAISS
jgi:hypothetical protein